MKNIGSMKYRFSATLAVAGLVGLMMLSCANSFTGNPAKAADPAAAGPSVLTVTLGGAASGAAKTIVPGEKDLPTLASYDLKLTCAGQTDRMVTFTGTTGSVSALVPGTWTVAVEVKTSAGVVVASGTNTVTVVASTVAQLERAPATCELKTPPLIVNAVPLTKLAAAVPRVSVPLFCLMIVRAVPPSLSAPSVRLVLAAVSNTALPVSVVAPKVTPAVPLVALPPAVTFNW